MLFTNKAISCLNYRFYIAFGTLNQEAAMDQGRFQTIPGLVFVKDLSSRFINVSQEFTRQAGFRRVDSLIGLEDYNMPWAEYADRYRNDDSHVLKLGRLQQLEPFINHQKDYSFLIITKDIFRENSNIAGIIGTAQLLNELLLKQLLQLRALDKKFFSGKLLHRYTLQKQYSLLTKRESEVLFLLIRYFSSKNIAEKLGLSHRTVEKYIESIKSKLNLNSKNDIIEYAIQNHLIEIIINL